MCILFKRKFYLSSIILFCAFLGIILLVYKNLEPKTVESTNKTILTLNRIQNEDGGFSDIALSQMKSDLHSTYYSISILESLNYDYKKSIVKDWIATYDCTSIENENTADVISQYYYYVMTSEKLDYINNGVVNEILDGIRGTLDQKKELSILELYWIRMIVDTINAEGVSYENQLVDSIKKFNEDIESNTLTLNQLSDMALLHQSVEGTNVEQVFFDTLSEKLNKLTPFVIDKMELIPTPIFEKLIYIDTYVDNRFIVFDNSKVASYVIKLKEVKLYSLHSFLEEDLVGTYYAIKLLNLCDFNLPDKEKIIETVIDLKDEKGGFKPYYLEYSDFRTSLYALQIYELHGIRNEPLANYIESFVLQNRLTISELIEYHSFDTTHRNFKYKTVISDYLNQLVYVDDKVSFMNNYGMIFKIISIFNKYNIEITTEIKDTILKRISERLPAKRDIRELYFTASELSIYRALGYVNNTTYIEKEKDCKTMLLKMTAEKNTDQIIFFAYCIVETGSEDLISTLRQEINLGLLLEEYKKPNGLYAWESDDNEDIFCTYCANYINKAIATKSYYFEIEEG